MLEWEVLRPPSRGFALEQQPVAAQMLIYSASERNLHEKGFRSRMFGGSVCVSVCTILTKNKMINKNIY